VLVDKYQSGGASTSFNVPFALRGVDRNNVNWWIAKSNPADTSTYWRKTPYTFDTSVSWPDVMAEETSGYGAIEVNQDVNISSPILTDVSVCTTKKKVRIQGGRIFFWDWYYTQWQTFTYKVPTNPEYVSSLYLDVYMLRYNLLGTYDPYIAYFGDFDVDIKVQPPNNYLESQIGYFASKKEEALDIFDSDEYTYSNGIYNMDDDYILRSINKWRSRPYDNYIKIQHKYMEDMAQNLSSPQYSFSCDVKSKDSSLFTLGNIYTHSRLTRDGSLMEFICNGLDYNVKDNTYRLDLMEFSADNNWRVDPSYCSIGYNPSTLIFDYQGNPTGTDDVSIYINRPYSLSSSDAWISWTVNSSSWITFDTSLLTDVSRNGTVNINVADCDGSTRTIYIHQDQSIGLEGYIELYDGAGLDVSIKFVNMGTNTIDISVLLFCYSYAVQSCDPYSADSAIDFMQGAAQCGCDSYTNITEECPPDQSDYDDASTYCSGIGISDTSSKYITFSGTDYYAGQTGESGTSGWAWITRAKYHGTNIDVSVHLNYVSWQESDHSRSYEYVLP